MDLRSLLTRRRMSRSFRPDRLDPAELDEVLDLARRAPSAGNSQAVTFVVLEGEATARYWDVTLPEERRASFRWTQLLDAPALVLLTTRPDTYVERYAEPDKERTGLGVSAEAWAVPYWWVDAGAVVQNLLLLAEDRGWGACLFGPFDNEPALKDALGVDADRRLVATIALGLRAPDEPGRSARRPRPPLPTILHRPGLG